MTFGFEVLARLGSGYFLAILAEFINGICPSLAKTVKNTSTHNCLKFEFHCQVSKSSFQKFYNIQAHI